MLILRGRALRSWTAKLAGILLPASLRRPGLKGVGSLFRHTSSDKPEKTPDPWNVGFSDKIKNLAPSISTGHFDDNGRHVIQGSLAAAEGAHRAEDAIHQVARAASPVIVDDLECPVDAE